MIASQAQPCPTPARPLTIGPLTLSSNLLLAPIAGYCDLAHRVTCRRQGGVGMASTDLLSPHGLLRGTAESLDLAATNDEDEPLCMQLYGAEPDIMAEGARWAVRHGARCVDINMGCPVDKICKKNGGSKLMCDLSRAVDIARAVRSAMPAEVPLTAKMRLGWSEADYEAGVACELSRRLIDVRVAAITVHGRTTEQRFRGECRREGIRRVTQAVREHAGNAVPVIGNGDVNTPEDALAMVHETGCAGVMIGRGSFARPWLLDHAWRLMQGQPTPDEPDDDTKLAIFRDFFERMHARRGEKYALLMLRKRINALGKTINGSHCKPLREALRAAAAAAQVHDAIDRWLDGSLERPSVHTEPSLAALDA